ncbi:DUF456 domain-containing protein [candidate division NPL-UPA2 bacterium]|nr:DUF456 domain-containing protein [candidate division NPL-UPA2 bacterium]
MGGLELCCFAFTSGYSLDIIILIMETLGAIIFIIFLLASLTSLFFNLPGTLIILIGALIYGFFTDFAEITVKILVFLTMLYLAGELLEYILVIVGARKFGASRKASGGAMLGGILGAILGMLAGGIGLVLGAFLGIFLGAFLVEIAAGKDLSQSFKAGAGGLFGRVSATVLKVIIALVMLILIIPRLF